MRRFLATVAVAALLSACSSNDKKALEPAKLVDFEATASLKAAWKQSAGKGQDVRYTRFVPAIDGENIYAADAKGRVFAYNATTGNKLWSSDLDKTLSAAISSAYGILLVGTYDGEVIALDAENGEIRWTAQASSEIMSPPQTNGRVVVTQSIDGRVSAFNAETGENAWSYDHVTPVLTLRGSSTPLVSGSNVIVAFDNGQIVSLSLSDGSTQWEARVSQPKGRTELERIVDIDGSPISVGSFIYAANYQGNIAALSRNQGRVLWKKTASTYQDLAYSGGKIYLSSDDSTIRAFNMSSGDLEWENDQLARRSAGSPVVIGDYVAVTDMDGYMHLMSQEDGTFAYRFKPRGNAFRSSPISKNGFLYVLSDNGALTAYTLSE